MAKFPLYQWKKAGEGSSSIDTQNFASKIKANTFTQKNTFENTGSVINVKTTDNQAFGIEFKNSSDQAVAYVGATANNKAFIYSANGMNIETTNQNIDINPGSGDCYVNTSKNWNQQLSNSVVRQRDLSLKRFIDYNSGVNQPNTTWNTENWVWTQNDITSTNGFQEFIVIVSINNVAYTLNTKLVWKSGLSESKSQVLTITDGTNDYFFQIVLKPNKFHIYHKKSGGNGTIQWVRAWVVRDINLPWKTNTLW